jgi:hypothetical protein
MLYLSVFDERTSIRCNSKAIRKFASLGSFVASETQEARRKDTSTLDGHLQGGNFSALMV